VESDKKKGVFGVTEKGSGVKVSVRHVMESRRTRAHVKKRVDGGGGKAHEETNQRAKREGA